MTNKKAVKLKECPFCGEIDVREHEYVGGQHTIECLTCGTTGPMKDTKGKAKKAWNSRVIDLDLLKKLIDRIGGANAWNKRPRPKDASVSAYNKMVKEMADKLVRRTLDDLT